MNVLCYRGSRKMRYFFSAVGNSNGLLFCLLFFPISKIKKQGNINAWLTATKKSNRYDKSILNQKHTHLRFVPVIEKSSNLNSKGKGEIFFLSVLALIQTLNSTPVFSKSAYSTSRSFEIIKKFRTMKVFGIQRHSLIMSRFTSRTRIKMLIVQKPFSII